MRGRGILSGVRSLDNSNCKSLTYFCSTVLTTLWYDNDDNGLCCLTSMESGHGALPLREERHESGQALIIMQDLMTSISLHVK